MEIQQHFIKFKFHIIVGVLLSASFFTILSIAPRFVDLLVYFWPLLASTALFLTVVLVFSRVSPPATDGPGDKAAEGLLDYVAGQTEVITETYTHD